MLLGLTPLLGRGIAPWFPAFVPDCFNLDHPRNQVVSDLNLSKEQFVDLCILCGCDYTDKIGGIGPYRALQVRWGQWGGVGSMPGDRPSVGGTGCVRPRLGTPGNLEPRGHELLPSPKPDPWTLVRTPPPRS